MNHQCTIEQLELALPILNMRTKNINSTKFVLTVKPHICNEFIPNIKMAMIADIVALTKTSNGIHEAVIASVHRNYTLTSVNKDIALFEIIYSWLSELPQKS